MKFTHLPTNQEMEIHYLMQEGFLSENDAQILLNREKEELEILDIANNLE